MSSSLDRFIPGVLLLVVASSCSLVRPTAAGGPCEQSPQAATLVYPQSGVRNVSTSLSEIVLSGASEERVTKLSLIDSGGRRIDIGPLHPIARPSNAPSGTTYRAAAVATLAATTNYIVLYSPVGCEGATDYAIGSFTTE